MATQYQFALSGRLGSVSLILILALVVPIWSQTAPTPEAAAQPSQSSVSDYVVGPGDILTVTIEDTPERTGKYRVTEDGYLFLPLLSAPIKVQGLAPIAVSRVIAAELQKDGLYRDPVVNVFVEEFHSRNVTVLGAVQKPSVYPLQRPTTVLEMISLAGGMTAQAGSIVTITRNQPPAPKSGEPALTPRPITLDLAKLTKTGDSSQNLILQSGDVITVSNAPVVYVIGAVVKPGGYVLQDSEAGGVSVLQALAMAEGLKPVAAGGRAVIIRRSADGQDRENLPVNVSEVLSGKKADHSLEPNDILFVPESTMKKSLKVMGDVAIAGLNGVAIYGLGYRVAGVR